MNYRRFFLKTIFKIGVLSIFPNKILAFNNTKNCQPTTTDLLGPFYIVDSPNIYNLAPPNINANSLTITGTVYANDCTTPIPNATVDVWHANQGEYDPNTNTYLNAEYEDEFYRSKLNTDNNGNYAFQTILPGKYENVIEF